MKIEIKSWVNGSVLFEGDFSCLAEAVTAAVKSGANLINASLNGANLDGANLDGARLIDARLDGASLNGARLIDARLDGASLINARLIDARLDGASLINARLDGANLDGASLLRLVSRRTILAEGNIFGYKKLANDVICKLLIPAEAKRVGGLLGRKCRAEYAFVIDGEGASKHNSAFKYVVGATVRPMEKFNDNPMEECASGIHFFITRQEAEEYH